MSENRTQLAPADAHTRVAAFVLAGFVTFLTLTPFGFAMPDSFGLAMRGLISFDLATPSHVLPALLMVLLLRTGWGVTAKTAATTIGIGLLGLEITQTFLENRHARAGDLLAQSFGLWLGTRMTPLELSTRLWRRFWAAFLAVWIGIGLFVGIRGQFGHTLGPMDDSFFLAVGDEYGGGRPWLGDNHGFSIATGSSIEDTETLITFESGDAAAESWVGTGPMEASLVRDEQGWSSSEPVSELSNAIDAARGVALTIDITPATLDQEGPTRIVSISKGPSLRNLTIGQERAALICRVRTPRSGKNASSPQFEFPDVLRAGERTELTVWTEGGSAQLWRGKTLLSSQQAYATPRDWLGLRPGIGGAVGPVVLFAPIGLAAAMLLGRRGWIVAGLTPIAVVGLVLAVAESLDRPMAWWLVPASAGLSLIGFACSNIIVRRRS